VGAASDEPLEVFAIYELKYYRVGDEVELTIHIFFKDEYIDPENFTVIYGAKSSRHEAFPQKVSTGIFTVTFTINQTIITYSTSCHDYGDCSSFIGVPVVINVDYQGYHVEKDVNIGMEILRVDLSVNDHWPRLGDTIEIVAQITNNSRLFDPEEITMKVVIDDSEDNNEIDLPLNHKGTGLYSANFTIEPNDNKSHAYTFDVRIKNGAASESNELTVPLRYYQIWYKNTTSETRGDTITSFDLYVASMDGAPVKEANIEIAYSSWDDWNFRHPKILSGTTDESGKTSFSLNVQEKEIIRIKGNATHDHHQDFIGEIDLRTSGDPDDEHGIPYEYGLDVFGEYNQLYFGNEEITIPFKVYWDGKSLEEGELIVYTYSDFGMINHERISVVDGEFSHTLVTPEVPDGRTYAFIEYKFLIEKEDRCDDDRWVINIVNRDFMNDVKIEIDELNIGGMTEISITDDRYVGYEAIILIQPWPDCEDCNEEHDDRLTGHSHELQWNQWVESKEMDGYFPLNEVESGEYRGRIFTPAVWKQEDEFMISSRMFHFSEGSIVKLHGGEVTLRDGEGTTQNAGKNEFLYGATLSIVIIAMGLLFYWKMRMKS